MTTIRMSNVSDDLPFNVDKTVVYFDTHFNYTVVAKRAKTMSVRRGCSSKKRCTVSIFVAANGTKLSLFVIFKVAENGLVPKTMLQMMRLGMFGST